MFFFYFQFVNNSDYDSADLITKESDGKARFKGRKRIVIATSVAACIILYTYRTSFYSSIVSACKYPFSLR